MTGCVATDFLPGGVASRSEHSHELDRGLWCRDHCDEEEWEIEKRSRMEIVAAGPHGAREFATTIGSDCVEMVFGAVCKIPLVRGELVARMANRGDDAERAIENSGDHVWLSLGVFATLILNRFSRDPVLWSARVIGIESTTLRNLYRTSS